MKSSRAKKAIGVWLLDKKRENFRQILFRKRFCENLENSKILFRISNSSQILFKFRILPKVCSNSSQKMEKIFTKFCFCSSASYDFNELCFKINGLNLYKQTDKFYVRQLKGGTSDFYCVRPEFHLFATHANMLLMSVEMVSVSESCRQLAANASGVLVLPPSFPNIRAQSV